MKSQLNIYKNKKPALLFLLPALLFMTVYLFYPFFQNLLNSFLEIRSLGSAADGLNEPLYQNYAEMFRDKYMHIALKNTVIMIAVTLAGQLGIALVLALMTDHIGRGARFFHTVYFFPIVVSATALGLMFNLIFLYDKGMLNQLLELLGKTGLTDWKDASHAMATMMIPVVWQYVGFYFIILVTGLDGIPNELYESAAIDGATRLQRVRYLSLPLLRNVICTCAVLAVTGALKVFDLPWVMLHKGMPMGRTWLLGTYMYYQCFDTADVDYSSAIAVFIVILGVVLSKAVRLFFREKEQEGGRF